MKINKNLQNHTTKNTTQKLRQNIFLTALEYDDKLMIIK
jgi:hypothetical protein